MTDQANNPSSAPLFQNMDEQERIYAPEQVAGTNLPPEEIDANGTAASGTANTTAGARYTGDEPGATTDTPGTGAAKAQPDAGMNAPIAVPIVQAPEFQNRGDTGTIDRDS